MNHTSSIQKRFPLQPSELAFKKAWMNGDKTLLDSAMTYSQYKHYLDEGICIRTPFSHHYQGSTEEHLGNTIKNVEDLYPGNEIYITIHGRYSYPVMHNHSYIELIYVYHGSCKHFIEDNSFTMQMGDLCILAPNTMHSISVSDDDTIVVNIMLSREVFDRSFLELLRGGSIVTKFFENFFYGQKVFIPYMIYPTGDDEDLQRIILWMHDEITDKRYAYQKNLHLLIQTMFIYLIRKYEMLARVSTATESQFNNHVVAVLGYLSINYRKASLNDTAAFFGYAPNYLGKMLRKYTGKTYTEIIQGYQLENAKKLLDETDMSITDISQEVGCYDASHFTRKFKKLYGVSPSDYRTQKQRH